MNQLIVLAATIAVSLAAAAASQTVEGVDVGRARERAKAHAKDIDAFAREVGRRGEALKSEAEATREAGMANRARLGSVKLPGKPGGAIDFDELVAGADKIAKAELGEGPRFIAFASTSMPPASLKRMMQDVGAAGGVVVFRGFKNNSARAFMQAMSPLIDKGQRLDNVGIDPRLFRAFGIRAVPTYVVVSTDFEPCDGFACVGHVPPHDKIAGNVTAEHALSTFVQGQGPSAATAKLYLQRLRKVRR